jgi:hypothetical protein
MLMDTTREVEQMQNDLWMKRTIDQRSDFMFGMFATARRVVIDSLPAGLTDRQFKEQLYMRTYGEHLPEDFFKAESNND